MKFKNNENFRNSLRMSLTSNQNIIIVESNWINSKRKILRNLFIISLSWTFLFTAFQSMANLQSSLNSDSGIGTTSLSTIYITLVISCLFLPTIMIKKFGLKNTIIFSQSTYLLYIAANIYPKWFILLPCAVLLGVGAGPLWTAKCTYLTEIAGFYSKLSGEANEIVVNRFFGIFFCMFQMSQIIGNLISSTVLKPEPLVHSLTSTATRLLSQCGAADCPSSSSSPEEKIKHPELSTVYTLCFIYVVLGLISILLIHFLLNKYNQQEQQSNKVYLTNSDEKDNLLNSTLKQMKNPYQILIIPLTLWLGFSLAFIGADFTKSFVACAKGVDQVGYVMLCFGLTDVFGSYFFGRLIKYTGRVPCFLTGAVINYLMIILMLKWDISNSEKNYLFYLIPAFWGLADSAWQTQVNSIYGVLFNSNQEAAFANFRLWESLGFAISYAYSSYICTRMKLNLLIFYLSFGLLSYLIIELSEYRKKNTNERDASLLCQFNLGKKNTLILTALFVKLLFIVVYFVF